MVGRGALLVTPDASGAVSGETLDATVAVIEARLSALRAEGAMVVATPPDLLTVSLPAGDDATSREAITRQGTVTFVAVPQARRCGS